MSLPLPAGPTIPSVLQTAIWVRRPTEFLRYCRQKYGPTFTVRIPPRPIVLFSEPPAIKQIFAARGDEMHAGEFNQLLLPIVGKSSVLLLDEGPHMRQRKLLLPAFHGERMRVYAGAMQSIAASDIATWSSGTPFSLHPHMQAMTLDIILRTVFGADEGSRLDALRDALKTLLGRGEIPVSIPILSYLSVRPERETKPWFRWLLADRDRADALIYEQIRARRADPKAKERTDILAMLLEARDADGEPLTDAEIRDELVTALAAGHETTATALCWTFERVLATPRVHARLQAEIDSVPLDGGLPRLDAIMRLEYLDAVLRETLRLRPIIPVVGRILMEDATIGGVPLARGTAVAACIYLAHRNPDAYRDPDEFLPERFLGVKEDPNAWLPFGGGIRRCLGAAFAFYEMKIVSATILALRKLTLAQTPPARIVRRAITFSPEKGTMVIAEPRTAPLLATA
ncbi:MAG TPA: cytochrome P450 [Polyangiaceae bacterium]|jgi:cytochrome P450|nr:cytochrome P450 [Polyangiaceae bacterium]